MKVILKGAIISYPVLREPESYQGGPLKYKATLVVTDPDQIDELKKAVIAVGKEKFGEKFAPGIRKGKIKNPIKVSDEDTPGYPEGSIYIRTSSTEQPGMVAVWPDPETGKPARVGPETFYPGAIVNASVYCGAYQGDMNKGVTFYLNNLQFAAHGERLDNRLAAQDEFEVDENAMASLEDMEAPEEGDINEDLDPVAVGAGGEGDDLSDLLG